MKVRVHARGLIDRAPRTSIDVGRTSNGESRRAATFVPGIRLAEAARRTGPSTRSRSAKSTLTPSPPLVVARFGSDPLRDWPVQPPTRCPHMVATRNSGAAVLCRAASSPRPCATRWRFLRRSSARSRSPPSRGRSGSPATGAAGDASSYGDMRRCVAVPRDSLVYARDCGGLARLAAARKARPRRRFGLASARLRFGSLALDLRMRPSVASKVRCDSASRDRASATSASGRPSRSRSRNACEPPATDREVVVGDAFEGELNRGVRRALVGWRRPSLGVVRRADEPRLMSGEERLGERRASWVRPAQSRPAARRAGPAASTIRASSAWAENVDSDGRDCSSRCGETVRRSAAASARSGRAGRLVHAPEPASAA